MLAAVAAEGITWLRKRIVVEAEVGAAGAEGSNDVVSTGTMTTRLCGYSRGLEMATSGRGRRWVGVGTGQRWEEKEEGSGESLARAMVLSGLVVSHYRKQRCLATTWLQATASTTNDDGCQLVEEEEGIRKQGKWQHRDRDGSERSLLKVVEMMVEEDDDDDDGKGSDGGVDGDSDCRWQGEH
ncbi:hypothetical protein B296_00000780 [Ensete ventricosum]|uniref:Uncharacterized protein n=1 Tax=Ensete ventricosum TaxID=4639 RepID=A0A427A2S1_ENSVE|nr:hypothetical protein B296_00000780 [Ensete ventricosum]